MGDITGGDLVVIAFDRTPCHLRGMRHSYVSCIRYRIVAVNIVTLIGMQGQRDC